MRTTANALVIACLGADLYLGWFTIGPPYFFAPIFPLAVLWYLDATAGKAGFARYLLPGRTQAWSALGPMRRGRLDERARDLLYALCAGLLFGLLAIYAWAIWLDLRGAGPVGDLPWLLLAAVMAVSLVLGTLHLRTELERQLEAEFDEAAA